MTARPTPWFDLDRRFRVVTQAEVRHRELFVEPIFGGSLSWEDLLNTPRVVVLAEAGSGKTQEFTAKWRELCAAGRLACHAAVQDVARSGFSDSLDVGDLQRFESWLASDEAHCWFFIDSVDEAKDEGLRFETALRNLARAIAGREERATILISGRFSDWDFTADRAAVDEQLAIPVAPPPPAPINSHHALLRDTLAHRQAEKPAAAADPVKVVVMEPLDAERVQRFSVKAGAKDPEAFVAAIERGNLWRFAGRPLDLEWMAHYWEDHHQLGSLQQMLEASISARLADPKPAKRRRDGLNQQAARRALNRIGAALHMSGRDTLRLPSEALDNLPSANALSIGDVLPEWSAKDQGQLLSRPVFDPATLGRIRLHNDNEGAVRAYLTACWLRESLAANCPPREVEDLLFADTYRRRLIRPDMADVAAWLAIWFPAIADRIIDRDPICLLTRGDPGSLPVATRIRAIGASLAAEAWRDPWHLFGDEQFRRLADPAFDELLPEWWTTFCCSRRARHLLLRLIRLGRQEGGLDIARSAAFDETLDDVSQILAGFILAEMGTREDQDDLARHVLKNAKRLPREVVLNALERLFPKAISVDDFFKGLDAIGIVNEDGLRSVHPIGPDLAGEFGSAEELSRFIEAVVDRIGPLTGEDDDSSFAEAFAGPATAAALRLLELCPADTPAVVTDLVLRLHDRRSSRGIGPAESQLGEALASTPERKRASFWQAWGILRRHPWFEGKEGPNVWQMQHLGWPGALGTHDFEWLIADLAARSDPRERHHALGAACALARDADHPRRTEELALAISDDPDLVAAFAQMQAPPPESVELREMRERHEKARRENRERVAERDASWITFIDDLRANPAQLDQLQPQTEDTADARLVHLWRLLSSRGSSRSRYSVSDVSLLEPLVGAEVAQRFRSALIEFAARRMPSIPSDLPAEQRSSTKSFDIMGLAGTSLAATAPGWAGSLSEIAAERAARYAIVELNGFPDYMADLITARPEQVASILQAEIDGQINGGDADAHGMLDRIAHADQAVATLVAPHLRDRLGANGALSPGMLTKVVNVLARSVAPGDAALADLLHRKALADEPERAALYLSLLFAMDGDRAADCVDVLIRRYDDLAAASFCSVLFPRLVGGYSRERRALPPGVSFDSLRRLLRTAFAGIRRGDDIDHPSGEVYSPGSRDRAQEARNALLNLFCDTAGEATHAALIEWAETGGIDVEPEWLLELARRRAETDACLEEWRPEDVISFESQFGKAPATTADLQFLAMRRIEQIEHDLRDGRHTQSTTFQTLPDESAVQRWLGDRFETMQPQLFTVVRETHVADEKEPDLTLYSLVFGVSLPIEIKVIDGMSVSDIERALETQLCGQYLRHESARHGILLLIHQRARTKGWHLAGHGSEVPLPVVVDHLRAYAAGIRARTPAGPQPLVALIDVSKTKPLRRKRTRREGTPAEGDALNGA